MKSKIPTDAFDYYAALGPGRSYQLTATHFGVSKCAISKRAKKEDWPGRLARIEADARAASDKALASTLAEMQERHLKLLRAMGSRVVTALRDFPIEDGMDAVRAGEIVIKLERLIAGDVAQRSGESIAELMRHEMHLMLERDVLDDEPRLVEAVVGAASASEPTDEQADAG